MNVNTGVLEAKTMRVEAPSITHRTIKEAQAAPKVLVKDRLKTLEKKAFSDTKSMPGISVFAILGTLVISVLMVFVVLAQISYNETASESARLSAELRQLTEKHRTLELAFESRFDIKEVERMAKDELGMSRPEAAQIITINAIPRDTATVIVGKEETSSEEFTDFLESLLRYFKK